MPLAPLRIRPFKEPSWPSRVLPVEGVLVELLEHPTATVVAIQHVDVETLDMSPSLLVPSVGTQDRRYDKLHS